MTPQQIYTATLISDRFTETRQQTKASYDALRFLISRVNNGLITSEQMKVLEAAVDTLDEIRTNVSFNKMIEYTTKELAEEVNSF